GLNQADDPRQDAQYPTFSTGRHQPRWWRVRIEAAITRPATPREKHRGLPLEAEDGAVDVRLAQQHAGIIRQVPRREIVRAVNHDVVVSKDLERVVRPERRFIGVDVDERVNISQTISSRL